MLTLKDKERELMASQGKVQKREAKAKTQALKGQVKALAVRMSSHRANALERKGRFLDSLARTSWHGTRSSTNLGASSIGSDLSGLGNADALIRAGEFYDHKDKCFQISNARGRGGYGGIHCRLITYS
jgi:hypothetical protein